MVLVLCGVEDQGEHPVGEHAMFGWYTHAKIHHFLRLGSTSSITTKHVQTQTHTQRNSSFGPPKTTTSLPFALPSVHLNEKRDAEVKTNADLKGEASEKSCRHRNRFPRVWTS